MEYGQAFVNNFYQNLRGLLWNVNDKQFFVMYDKSEELYDTVQYVLSNTVYDYSYGYMNRAVS